MNKKLLLVVVVCAFGVTANAQSSFDELVMRIDNVSLSNVVVGSVASKTTVSNVRGELEHIEVNYLTTGMTCNVKVEATNASWGDVSTTLLFLTNTSSGASAMYRPRFPIQDHSGGTGADVLSSTNQNEKFVLFGHTINFWAAKADLTNRSIKVRLILRK